MTSIAPPRRLSVERERVNAATDEASRELARLRLAELEHVLACQRAGKTISIICSKQDAMIDGVANPNQPYRTWGCCDSHRALKTRRQELADWAQRLGVEPCIDVSQVVLED